MVVELPPETDLQILVKGLSSLGGLVCFDSSSAAADGFSYAVDAEQPNGARFLDRFSFVAADPIERFIVPSGNELGDAEPIREVLGQMKRRMAGFSYQTIPGLPPFQGGLAGMLSFAAGLALLGVESRKGSTQKFLSCSLVSTMLCLRLITSRERSGVFRKVCQEIPQRNGEFIVESVSKSTRVPWKKAKVQGRIH